MTKTQEKQIVIIIPGFLGYTEDISISTLQDDLIKCGFEVICIEWPHIGEDWSKYSLTRTLEYVRSVVGSAENLGRSVSLVGISLGGVIASFIASEYDLCKLGLVISPFHFSTGDDISEIFSKWKKNGNWELESSKYGRVSLPYSFVEDARRYNALDVIAKVMCPKLFIVGDEDRTVPNAVTQILFDKAKSTKKYVVIKGMRHKYKNQKGMMEKVNKEIVEFLSRA